MSERIGATKPVWHVVGPGGKNKPGSWWCFDTREQAEAHVGPKGQLSEGVATLSETEPGGSRFWAVKRPEWVAPVTTPLPLPDDPRLADLFNPAIIAVMQAPAYGWRSRWLGEFEAVLREHYPASTSKQRTLTARLAAPFTLARPGVP